MEHTKKFFTAKPRMSAVTKKSQPPVAVNETTSSQGPRSNGAEEDVTGSPLPNHLSIKFHECSIPEECIPTATLRAIFQKAELLINEEGAIKEAASNDERLRTVKSKDGGDPLIVKPLGKKSDLFQFVCCTYKALEICPDTVAVANDQGILFEYLCALRQKLTKKVSKGIAGVNLTAAIETGLRASEKGLKQDENNNKVKSLCQVYLLLPPRLRDHRSCPIALIQQCRLQAWYKMSFSLVPMKIQLIGHNRPPQCPLLTSRHGVCKHRPVARHGHFTSSCNVHSMVSQLHNQQLSSAIPYRRHQISLTRHFYTQPFLVFSRNSHYN